MNEIEWEVHLEAAGEGMVDDDLLGDFAEHLAEFGASITGSPEEPIDSAGRFGASFGVVADSPVQAIVTASDIFLTAVKKVGLPEWPIVKIELMTENEFARSLEQPTVPQLVGVTEIGQMLGVSRQRASELARTPRFPNPVTELASGPVWLAPNISKFVSEWQRRPGRPRKEAVDSSR